MSDLSRHLEVLAEPVRIRLLSALRSEELAVGELVRVVQLPQSTVSRHLKALLVAGWIQRRADGTSSWLRLDLDGVPEAARQLWTIVAGDFDGGLQHAEDQARLDAVLEARRVDSRTFFGREHARWDALRAELFGRAFLLPTLLSLLPGDLVVADLGCGTGEAVHLLAPSVGQVIGVDREQAMLEAAAVRCLGLSNVALRQGGLEDLPLCDGEVDAALLMLVLHHVDDVGRALIEVARVLRPGGRAVVLDMLAHGREDYRHTMGHVHLGFDEAGLAELACEAGLVVHGQRALAPTPDAQGPPLFLTVLGT